MNENSVTSYISKNDGLILSVCDGKIVMSSFLDAYVNSNIETIPTGDFDDIRRIISFCCAMAPFIPSDGLYSWTVSLPVKKRKIFCAIDMLKKTFVARTHKWEPIEHENSPRIAVQKISSNSKINSVSLIDCKEADHKSDAVGTLLEKYVESLDGFSSCMYEADNCVYILKPYMEVDSFIFNSYCNDLKNGLDIRNKMEMATFFDFSFNCGCNKQIISDVFSTLDTESLDFLFEKSDEITAECPRCGLKYIFKREALERDE